MGIQLFFVVNKAGGLIFVRSFQENAPKKTQNDYLHLASTFHGMQLLVKELSPEVPRFGYGGVQTLETASYLLHAFHSTTGVDFFVTADPKTERLPEFLREVYVIYADYVMKNPFYELDMPIKCDLWESHLRQVVDRFYRAY